MAKHSYDAESMTSCQIMSSVRVYRDGVTVGFIGSFGCEDFEVPTRPTGAHRHDEVPVDIATYIYATFVECVRDPTPGMMEFEFIDIPSV